MTMKTELDETERLSYEGALSRDRDPVVPRGAVVVGEQREAVNEAGGEELEVVAMKTASGALLPVSRTSHLMKCDQPLTPLLPAQERIRALEARLEELRPVVRAVLRNDRAENAWSDHIPEEWDEKSYEVDDELSAEVTASREVIVTSIDALSPATREWAEGEET